MTDATVQAIKAARVFVDERPDSRPYQERAGRIIGEMMAIEATARQLAEALLELSRPNKIDAERVERGDWQRASHLSECGDCGHAYGEHPMVPGFEWLRRLCDGRLVKL